LREVIQRVLLAYRTDLEGKPCNIQFAKEAFDQVKQKYSEEGECSVIALDVKGYFDNIDHRILRDMWCKVIGEEELPDDQYKVFRTLTKYSYLNYGSFLKHFDISLKKLEKEQRKKAMDKKKVKKPFKSLLELIPSEKCGTSFKERMQYLRDNNLIVQNHEYVGGTAKGDIRDYQIKKRGIPQGSAMSAVLSNVYLAEFDRKIFEKGQEEGFVYRRYCDDLLVICNPDRGSMN